MASQATLPSAGGGSKPAPGPLALIQAFLNTRDLESGQERLSSPDGLAAWLREQGLSGGDISLGSDDLARALAVREALRALLLANSGGPLDPAAPALLNREAARARLEVNLDRSGTPRLAPATGGLDGALASILGAVYTATAEGSWPRLKACRSANCRWVFYDASKNRSGSWCTMADCGNRAKARAYRQRRRLQSGGMG